MMLMAEMKAEKNCRWHAIRRDPKDNGVGPSEPMSENFRKTPYASLVRESIQNSLDVSQSEDMPVVVVFNIGCINSNNFPNFFEIEKHIEGCLDNFPNNEKAKKIYPSMLDYLHRVNQPGSKLFYIKVSDHNTLGMHYDNPENNDAPFYAFVRSAGVSSKSDDSSGGSFGFGKAAYFYLSALRTILVSTKTAAGKYYFEGVASLCSHKVDGKTLSNIIYYDNNEGHPVENYNDIPSRFQRKDDTGIEFGAGTDIYIMGIDIDSEKERTSIYEEMFKAVLENFWLAILHNKLIVKIGNKNNEDIIDASNIRGLMEQCFDEHDTNTRRNYNPRPYFDAVNLADSSERFVHRVVNLDSFEELKRFDRGYWGNVHYFFHKNKNAQNRIVYLRNLRMKVSVSPGRNGEGYYGVIFCPDGLCNSWLRQTEDPAHSKWDPKRLEKKEDKSIANRLLEIIEEQKNKIIREIFNLDSLETVKIQGLEQYLYISSDIDEEDENEEATSIAGQNAGIFMDAGFSPTTEVQDDVRAAHLPEAISPLGQVLIKTSDAVVADDKGTVLTGRGNHKIKKPHTNKYVSAVKPTQRNITTNDDANSYALKPVAVRYRAFAQNVDGKIIHKLKITSDVFIEHGQIDLLIGGESVDSKISIASSSKGMINQNSISGLTLPVGKTELDIRFADNLQHSIKLAAYEIK